MTQEFAKDIEYSYDGARLVGHLCLPRNAQTGSAVPGVVLVHDAFGVGDFMKQTAARVAALGYAVLAADVWGEGAQLRDESQIGPTIGRFASDRKTWMGRIEAGRQALAAQPGVDGARVAIMGYCFGGASALEYLRTVGSVRGAVSLHGGLDLVGPDWSVAAAGGKALILTGAEDPMAAAPKLLELQQAMSAAGVDWEANVYSHTKHGFTRPDSDRANKPQVIAYREQSDRRAWAALVRFLDEVLAA
ncbi:dienelactone hydrolase [Paraburkholderia unamae]|uniref:dienelactone hydrolase family protein n=1 Tax=Paraburkholderia unamae TaxID=219649 RepID=UPI000DC26C10|nr:dienelactone hydrolase family protein [Paraburkholderia unamae]RAR66112.1 dienelactone hydrolase [Paraburkholderia unamae]